MSATMVRMLNDIHNRRIWLDLRAETYMHGVPTKAFDTLTMAEDADLLGLFADRLAHVTDQVSDCGGYKLVKLTPAGEGAMS